MPIATTSVTDARQAHTNGATLVDVRSTAEFNDGHPAGALHVPLLDADEDTGQMMPNPDFIRVMRANFAPDTSLLLSCRTGGRSARAAQMLEAFGFTNLTNVDGGYEAWTPAGLPTETSTPDERAYATLLAKADEVG